MVCTANLCRSPLAEHLSRSLFASANFDCTVGSAGVNARTGEAMHPLTAEVLADRHIEVDDWSSRALTRELVESHDLILTATRDHLVQILTSRPSAVRRTFVLGQFSDFLTYAPRLPAATSLAELVQHAQRGRAEVRGDRAYDAYDLHDPIDGEIAAFEYCAKTIDGYLEQIAEHIEV